MNFFLALLGVLSFALVGVYLAAVFDRLIARSLSGPVQSGESGVADAGVLVAPLAEAAALMSRVKTDTEAPDRANWMLTPAWYLALAAVGLSVIPFAEGVALTRIDTGLVFWGAVEALTVVVIFLHGWSPNSPMPLIGAYRYAGIGLPIMLPSMFVLIAAAMPAESLSLVKVVESQREVWNIVRQPIGLPLFMLVGLTITLRGPFDYADGAELAGGTKAESAGPARAAWELARLAMLVSFSTMAATAFLGGPLGPGLPGPLWLGLKTLAVMAATQFAGQWFARIPPSQALFLLWVVILPLSFLDLLVVGLVIL